jgi:hypothetical protein
MSESISLKHFGRTKQSVSYEVDGPCTIYLPDSLVLKFDKKKDQTGEEAIQKTTEQFAGVDNGVLNNNNTESEPDNKSNLIVNITYDYHEDRITGKKEILIKY